MSTRSDAPTNLDQHVSKRIRTIRMQRGLSLKEVADKVGMAFQQFHKFEAGLLRVSAGLLISLAEVFDCEVTDFFPPELRGEKALEMSIRVEMLQQEIVNLVLQTKSEQSLLAIKTLLERQANLEAETMTGATG